jgi:IS6 family transposase
VALSPAGVLGQIAAASSSNAGGAELTASRFSAGFVVASPEVLRVGVTADDHAGGAVGLEATHWSGPRLSRPWSRSTRLFVYCSVLCTASGNNSAITWAGAVALTHRMLARKGAEVKRRRRPPTSPVELSVFAGFRFPPEVIMLAVRWYLRFGLSYRDLEELLAERGIDVDHVTVYRWVQRFTPLLIDAARPCRHSVGSRWFVDETYVKVAGVWRYVYRAVDEYGQVIDVLVSRRRDITAARRFFIAVIDAHGEPGEVVTDRAAALAYVIAELVPDAMHNTEQYANNRVECDHGRLKARLRPMRGLKTDRTARVIIRAHAFMQNLRRGHYELGIEARHDQLRGHCCVVRARGVVGRSNGVRSDHRGEFAERGGDA